MRKILMIAAACLATSAAAQTQDVINWCNRYNRNPMAVARCIRAETDQARPQQPYRPGYQPLYQQRIEYPDRVAVPAVAPPQQPAQVQQPAPPADPYAQAQMQEEIKRYVQINDDIIKDLWVIGFAVGCKVIPKLDLAMLVALAGYHRLEGVDQRIVLALHDAHDPRVPTWERWKRAEQDGLDRAQNEGCDFWKDHPEAVTEMRERVRAQWPAHGG
jgi:hypothetical protein